MAFGLFTNKVGHQALYADLCKLHDLDRKTKAAFDLIVQLYDLKQPAMLFVDPNIFRQAITHKDLAQYEDTLRETCFRWFGRRI